MTSPQRRIDTTGRMANLGSDEAIKSHIITLRRSGKLHEYWRKSASDIAELSTKLTKDMMSVGVKLTDMLKLKFALDRFTPEHRNSLLPLIAKAKEDVHNTIIGTDRDKVRGGSGRIKRLLVQLHTKLDYLEREIKALNDVTKADDENIGDALLSIISGSGLTEAVDDLLGIPRLL